MGIELTEHRPEQGRIDKLPVWVRDYIERFEIAHPSGARL